MGTTGDDPALCATGELAEGCLCLAPNTHVHLSRVLVVFIGVMIGF